MLTVERLREIFDYDATSGFFLRKSTDKRRRGPATKLAGWTDAKGYLRIQVDGKTYGAHALAWLYVYGKLPAAQIDHINARRADNRIENLRTCDTQQNCAGRLLRKDNATGFKGVSRINGRWRARIRVNYRGIDLGRYDTAEDAARAYDSAAIQQFGAFARTNATLGRL